ncbi:MAG: hypothetical protein AAF108_02220 [Planctomycetota bacterium]
MLIDGVTNAGAVPTLAASVQFAARRQELLANNIANLSTPDFRPMDVDPRGFQKVLREAVEERRSGGSAGRVRPGGGDLGWQETREVTRDASGRLRLTPRTPSGNVLFHDRNNRDLERTMQALAENAAAFRLATGLLRNRVQQMRNAIAERAV